MPINPEDYECSELPHHVQQRNLTELVKGNGPVDQVALIQSAMRQLHLPEEIVGIKARDVRPYIEKLRKIFAQHEKLWPIFFKKQPVYPAGMFEFEKNQAQLIVDESEERPAGEQETPQE